MKAERRSRRGRDARGAARGIAGFVRGVRAGATAIGAVVISMATLGSSAIITDHMWLVDQKEILRDASDAATVAATLNLDATLDADESTPTAELEAQAERIVRRYIAGNLGVLPPDRYQKAINTLVIDVTLDRAQRTVRVDAQASLGGLLLANHLAWIKTRETSLTMATESRVRSEINAVEVVLAIDTSSSMNDPMEVLVDMNAAEKRIDVVKRAAKALVSTLGPNATDRIAIGLVPWSGVVRIGDGERTTWEDENWAVYPTQREYAQPYRCEPSPACTPPTGGVQTVAATAPEPWKGCIGAQRMNDGGTTAELAPSTTFFETPETRAFAWSMFDASNGASYACYTDPLPADFGGHNACYDGVYLRRDGTTRPPSAPQMDCKDDTTPMLGLSTDADALQAAIDDLEPTGRRTYSALGMLWAQRMLDPSWNAVWGGGDHPSDPNTRRGRDVRKAIVLLTDGADTQCGVRRDCETSDVGHTRRTACDAVKAQGTEVFVIIALRPSQVPSGLADDMRACSSQDENPDGNYVFVDNTDGDALEEAFAEIADQLRVVRRVI